ncbi:MAG: hypothetical protein B7Z25_05085 [Aerococcus viridans]|nr:MAG: hypothetical protein B7Z25_05085 [Aerococcus viridans]
MPVHKAFESYLEGFLSFVFDFKISRDKNEGFTVGYYLKYPLEKKNVADIENLLVGCTLREDVVASA